MPDNRYVSSLVEASRKGSKNSYLQLCEMNAPSIYYLCLRVFADQRIAFKVTRHVFLISWKNIKQIREDTSFNLWLHGFTVNLILEYLRRSFHLSSPQPSPSPLIPHTISELDRQIMSLDVKERVIFILHDVIKYSYQEIADLLHELGRDEIKMINTETRNKLLKVYVK